MRPHPDLFDGRAKERRSVERLVFAAAAISSPPVTEGE
jgi:hypothetical protein